MARLTGKARRARDIARALRLLVPLVPMADAEAIREEASAVHMRSLPPSTAVWLATVAHIRYQHTDYDEMRDAGYDADSARHFTADAINAVLTAWRATRLLDPETPEDAV